VTPSRRQDARDRESRASEPVPAPQTHPRDAPRPAPTGCPVPVTQAEVPPFETECRTPPGYHIPPPPVPHDQRHDDAADPERLALVREAEDSLRNATQEAGENEDRREQNVKEQEAEGQRNFMENERRDEEARDETWQDLEQRLAPGVVHASFHDAQPVVGSVGSVSDVGPPQPADINKAELENERQLRATEGADDKEREQPETQEHYEGIQNQLGDITNLGQDPADACAKKKELTDQRWEESQAWQTAQDARCREMFDMVAKIVEDHNADRVTAEEERIANQCRPGRFPVCAFTE
jgi:hypothetical protein